MYLHFKTASWHGLRQCTHMANAWENNNSGDSLWANMSDVLSESGLLWIWLGVCLLRLQQDFFSESTCYKYIYRISACARVCEHMHTHICIHTNTVSDRFACMHVCMYIHTEKETYDCIYKFTSQYVYMHLFMFVLSPTAGDLKQVATHTLFVCMCI